jgi:hypothetical protein
LFFGRHPILPVDLLIPSKRNNGESEKQVSHTSYVDDWKKRMEEAYRVASQNVEKSAQRGKTSYDLKAYGTAVWSVGDHVLVRNLLEKGGPGKLRSYWEQEIYVVVDRPKDDLPVYDVKKLNGTGRVRRLHRSLLLLCNSLPIPDDCRRSKARTRRQQKRRNGNITSESSDSSADVTLTITSKGKPLNPLAKVFTPAGSSDGNVQEVLVPTQNLQEAGTIEVMETYSGSHLTSEPYVDCNDDDNPSVSLSD